MNNIDRAFSMSKAIAVGSEGIIADEIWFDEMVYNHEEH